MESRKARKGNWKKKRKEKKRQRENPTASKARTTLSDPAAFSTNIMGDVRSLRPTTSSTFPSLSVPRSRLVGRQAERPSSSTPAVVCRAALAPPERFQLNNLAPQPGSRKRNKRKGRVIVAGQGNSCGFGMRGQKSRSGPGVRKGLEGGQMPLYRRIPKLRGIAGGMHAGLPKFVPVNLKDIEAAGFQEGDEISLESLKAKGLINASGRDRRLPLKTLGDGDLSVKLNIKAPAFSAAAKGKLEAAGCTLTILPGRKKWVKPSVAKNLARAEEYFAKKRAALAIGGGGGGVESVIM
ncbi:50S ribosomal protein L15, chloroplastic-like [Cocos nucifera]|uniref:50S ribosomal protein L15, chloroplastic-like n=1 Tax=Cocos nucifera TaxID=13894 RepID=A0A8K0HYC8_COCNU|nr:50S ribosomal protein L15, chloroplastic-like [Cocos nucifera]